MNNFLERLTKKLKKEEGEKLDLYKCSAGKWTIGVGWNIEDNGIPQEVSDLLLAGAMDNAIIDARSIFNNFDELSDNRKIALADMSFQLGKPRLKKFVKMIAAIHAFDFSKASKEMLDSKYAGQTFSRAFRNAQLMESGS